MSLLNYTQALIVKEERYMSMLVSPRPIPQSHNDNDHQIQHGPAGKGSGEMKKSEHFSSRSEAIDFLYKVVDYYKENREIVQVALNYLDRYLSSTRRRGAIAHNADDVMMRASSCGFVVISSTAVASRTTVTATATCNDICTASGANGVSICGANHSIPAKGDIGSSPMTTIQEEEESCYDKTATTITPNQELTSSISSACTQDDIHNIVVLCCLDLAMKLYSPLSGDVKRAAFVEIIDEALETQDNQEVKKNKKKESLSSSPSSSSPTPYDFIGSILDTLSVKDCVSRLSKKYNGNKFESICQLSRNLYTAQEFAVMQTSIMNSLEYYLHPPTSHSFISHFAESLGDSKYIDSDLCLDLDDISDISDYANMQVELALFDVNLATTKPSILAFCALQNAIIQYYYTLGKTSEFTTATASKYNDQNLLSFAMQETLQCTDIVIGKQLLKVSEKDHSELSTVRECLFKHWKKNKVALGLEEQAAIITSLFCDTQPDSNKHTPITFTTTKIDGEEPLLITEDTGGERDVPTCKEIGTVGVDSYSLNLQQSSLKKKAKFNDSSHPNNDPDSHSQDNALSNGQYFTNAKKRNVGDLQIDSISNEPKLKKRQRGGAAESIDKKRTKYVFTSEGMKSLP